MSAATRFLPLGLGWQRDLPDPRDYTPEHPRVMALLSNLPASIQTLPAFVDLRADDDGIYFSPPGDQGRLNSSTAFSCLALIEYFERKVLGQTFDAAPRFLYEMSRRLCGTSRPVGFGIRSTIKALCRYGTPPEEMMPYSDEDIPEPVYDVSLLGFARELADLVYFRLDLPDSSGKQTLTRLKSFLAAGFPVVFGFPVPRSLTEDGVIPYRPQFDAYRGGQTVLAVGYDDEVLPGRQGAIRIRNSWGTAWGEQGYGWLPYSLVIHGQVADLWTAFRSQWAETKTLFRPAMHKPLGQSLRFPQGP